MLHTTDAIEHIIGGMNATAHIPLLLGIGTWGSCSIALHNWCGQSSLSAAMSIVKVFSNWTIVVAKRHRLQIVASLICVRSFILASEVSFFLHELLLGLIDHIVSEVVAIGG